LNSNTGGSPRHAGRILVFRFQGPHSSFVLIKTKGKMTANSLKIKVNRLVHASSETIFHVVSTHPEGDVPVCSGSSIGSTHPASHPASITAPPRRTHLTAPPSGGPFFSAVSCTRTIKRAVSRASPCHGPPWCEGRSLPYAPRSRLPDTGERNPVDYSDGAGRSRQSQERLRHVSFAAANAERSIE
jgi:hypothetical protein